MLYNYFKCGYLQVIKVSVCYLCIDIYMIIYMTNQGGICDILDTFIYSFPCGIDEIKYLNNVTLIYNNIE